MNIHLSETGLASFERVRKRQGLNRFDIRLCIKAGVSPATLGRFLARRNVRAANFIHLCQSIGIEEWDDLVEWDDKVEAKK